MGETHDEGGDGAVESKPESRMGDRPLDIIQNKDNSVLPSRLVVRKIPGCLL